MRSARQHTLSRMRMLIAASTTAVASINCNECGYTTVDPLPGPGPIGGGGGFCGGVGTTFKVGARTYTPAELRDASTPEPAGDAGDGGEDDGGASRRDAGAGADAGGGANTTKKQRTTFFAVEVRSATPGGGVSSGVSLKRAVFSSQPGTILGVRQSELLTEMDIDSTDIDELIVTMIVDASCGGGAATIRFEIRLDTDGRVIAIAGSDSFGGGTEDLVNEL